jgi:hypothetical protein
VRTHRGILAIVLLTVLALSGLSAAGYFWLLRLPHPSEATRDQLLHWLVLREVANEPPEVQQALVDRLQEELLGGLEPGADAAALSSAYREQLQRNISTLKRVWFETRTQQYAACPAGEKFAFVERQIAVVAAWSTFELDVHHGSSDDSPSGSAGSQFFDEIETWIADAEGERRQRMIRGVRDGLVCWLATRSLAEQPVSLRRDLANRIARELDYGLKLDGTEGALNDTRRRQLGENGLLLLEAWLGEQALRYAQLDAQGRASFLDERIDAFSRWNVAPLLGAGAAATGATVSANNSTAALFGLSRQLDTWIERAAPAEQNALRLLADDLRRQVALRALRGLLPVWPK